MRNLSHEVLIEQALLLICTQAHKLVLSHVLEPFDLAEYLLETQDNNGVDWVQIHFVNLFSEFFELFIGGFEKVTAELLLVVGEVEGAILKQIDPDDRKHDQNA